MKRKLRKLGKPPQVLPGEKSVCAFCGLLFQHGGDRSEIWRVLKPPSWGSWVDLIKVRWDLYPGCHRYWVNCLLSKL